MKKKIDLAQLQDAEPDLFTQFKSHFNQMGEKSFDHTKKYWSNKLRRLYPLSVEEETRLKAAFSEAKATAAEGKIPEEKERTGVVTAKPAGFKPKFKAAAAPKEEVPLPPTEISEPKATREDVVNADLPEAPKEQAPATEETKAPAPKGFKPRFKPGMASPKKEETGNKEDVASQPQQEDSAAAKPTGFKPRFKPGVTKKAEEKPEDNLQEETAPPAVVTKPSGFKPRFKAGLTDKDPGAPLAENKPEPELPPRQIETSSEEKTEPSEQSFIAEGTTKEDQAASKPVGFKPRFKAGLTGKKEAGSENVPVKEPELPPRQIEDISRLEEESSSASEERMAGESVTKPLGFKPRFKAGVTGKKEEASENVSPKEPEPVLPPREIDDTPNSKNRVNSTAADASVDESAPEDVPVTKPLGFKPGFKAGKTK